MREHHLSADDIVHVRAHVHQAALDVLGPVTDPQTVHQAKFSMGFVLALIALYAHAGVADFTAEALRDRQIRAFLGRVDMVLDPEIDAAYPERWIGLVEVETTDGRRFVSRVDVPKGDPGNGLSRPELVDKAVRLAAFQGGAAPQEVQRIVDRVWVLDQQADVRDLLPAGSYSLA
jgi:2-methylcitrate dehydratase PrpD